MKTNDFLSAGEVGKEIVRQTGDLMKEPVENIVNSPTNVIGRGLLRLFRWCLTQLFSGQTV